MAPFKRTRPMAHERDPNYKFGRPSAYRQEYCEQVIAFMAKGHSLAAFAGKIGHNQDTVYEWIATHPDFSDAVKRARAARLVPWEEKLMTATRSAEAACTIFALKNADPNEWREVRYNNIETTVNLNILTDAQLEAIAAGKPAPQVIESTAKRIK